MDIRDDIADMLRVSDKSRPVSTGGSVIAGLDIIDD